MTVLPFHPGDLISGPRWRERVEIRAIHTIDEEYIRLEGVLRPSGQYVDQILPVSELRGLRKELLPWDLTGEPRCVFLGLETLRYRSAALYDPLLAVNISKVDPLPHQIEAVYGYVLNLPRIRFLIADDPGAGKTIMAGLVVKELKLRRLAQRILIVVPGHLKDQWRREMKERFKEYFVVVDRRMVEALFGENVWLRENQIITSIDFAKREDVLGSLAASHFDLVIVDEAHKMSAYRYGNKLERTARYRLGEVLSQITTHMLFLTATPHKGDPENFRLFLDLLVPGFFANEDLLQESIRNRDNPLFIRRIKEDLKDFEGKPLFLPRHVRTISFDLGRESPQEKALYNDLSRYVQTQYNKALTKDRRRNVAFALVILQRRFASSTYALYRSLERRKKRLEDLLRMSDPERRKHLERPTFLDLEEAEDASEADRWQQEEIWETLTVAENRRELEREIETVERLLRQAGTIIRGGEEVKLRHFRQVLDDLERRFPGEKILIFTVSMCSTVGSSAKPARLSTRPASWPSPAASTWPRSGTAAVPSSRRNGSSCVSWPPPAPCGGYSGGGAGPCAPLGCVTPRVAPLGGRGTAGDGAVARVHRLRRQRGLLSRDPGHLRDPTHRHQGEETAGWLPGWPRARASGRSGE